MSDITWEPKKVLLKDLIENPDNPKIITDLGRKRLKKSIERFGFAGMITCNLDLSIIDGHSRKKELENSKIKEVWVLMPSKLLTEKEYKDFNALYDVLRAGQPDMPVVEETVSEEVIEEMDMEQQKEKQKGSALKYLELKPYVKTHVLLSFPPEKMIHIQELLQKITDVPGVEYEQSSN